MSGVKKCFPQCQDFKCTKSALRYQGGNAWCDWTSEPCDPKSCNFALCYKRQLVDNGVCGMSIKRRTREDIEPEQFPIDEVYVKGKVMRKLGDRKIF